LQSPDGRVVFALPYGELNLIGTTDAPVERPEDAEPSAEEIDYLCAAANGYFVKQTGPEDVRWAFAGIRALYDDGAADAKDVTREYRLEREDRDGAKLLSVFGGKITTARALAEEVMGVLGVGREGWTRVATLPGGDLSETFKAAFRARYADLPGALLDRLLHAYGSRAGRMLSERGRHFGADLYEAEVRYLVQHEFARTAQDVLWRRSKLGLRLDDAERNALAEFMTGMTTGQSAL
jgi:glycerol-3-phosphate dehydrogenase